jgi:putative ABC transport system ATP-binding protein
MTRRPATPPAVLAALAIPAARPLPGTNGGSGRTGPTSGPVLQATELEKRFGAVVALDGVDLAMHRGESVAVMGPSGSGKSTLLHCLAGIARPDGGTVWLDGRRIDNLGERNRTRLRRGQFGFVFQSGQLLPELPAAENVALPLMLEGRSRRSAVEPARRWLASLGLDGLDHRRPGELSGGQAQRVAIARALVTSPAVVFADEPTAALDQATGLATVQLLVRVTAAAGAALLIVTHDPGVAALCTRTIHIRDGRLGAAPPAPAPGATPGTTTGTTTTGAATAPGEGPRAPEAPTDMAPDAAGRPHHEPPPRAVPPPTAGVDGPTVVSAVRVLRRRLVRTTVEPAPRLAGSAGLLPRRPATGTSWGWPT